MCFEGLVKLNLTSCNKTQVYISYFNLLSPKESLRMLAHALIICWYDFSECIISIRILVRYPNSTFVIFRYILSLWVQITCKLSQFVSPNYLQVVVIPSGKRHAINWTEFSYQSRIALKQIQNHLVTGRRWNCCIEQITRIYWLT